MAGVTEDGELTSGFCWRGNTCDFEHPVKLCEQYKLEGECSRRLFKDRHIFKAKRVKKDVLEEIHADFFMQVLW